MEEDCLKEQLGAISKNYGAIGAFIHLNPLNSTLASAQAIIKQVFLMAKYLKPSLNQAANHGYSCFVTVSRLDGELGVSQSSVVNHQSSVINIPISGGLFGLTKSLNLEWENVFCRTIDFSPELDTQTTTKSILAELYDPNRSIVEVGYGLQGRMTLVGEAEADSEPIHGEKPSLNQDSVLLVSGGGRGITAQCAIQLAKYFQCKFILLGRSSLNPEPEWAKGYQSEVELKRQAISYLSTQGEKPKPIQVNQLVKPILAQREIQKTLQAIMQARGQAEYLSVDITNELTLKEKLASIVNKLGQITGIIHGAGVLADKLIEKKSAQDFDNVYAPKVTGLQNILSCVQPSQLHHLVLFSSVAGFYGNIGQTDYAIANEILNKFAYNFQHKYPQCQVIAMNWGPWDGGMVTPEIKRIFTQKNIEVIPIQLGTEILVDELNRNNKNRTQVLVGSPLFVPAPSLSTELKNYQVKCTLNLEENIFLQDHMIGGNPVFPMTCAVEWVANTCEQVYTGYKYFSLENFKVLKGITFDGNESQEYIFNIQEKNKKIGKKIELEVFVFSKIDNNKRRYRYSSKVTLLSLIPSRPLYQSFNNKQDPEFINLEPYQDGTLFQRGSFQGITKVLNINPQRINLECTGVYTWQKIQEYISNQGFNPNLADVTVQSILTDITMQSGLVWLQHFHQTAALPSYIGKVEFFQDLPLDKIFYVATEILSYKNNKLTANITIHNNQGLIYYQAFNVEGTVSKRLKNLFALPQKKPENKSINTTQKSVLFSQEQISEFCLGSIAKCFGSEYAIYDQGKIKTSRLPNTELNLVHRVLEIKTKQDKSLQGSTIVIEYDAPLDPWYYQQNSSATTPYSILMELGLQPCGFLSAYWGITLFYLKEDLYFRNLDGQGKLIKNIDIRGKTVTSNATLTNSTQLKGIILQGFTFELACEGAVFYQGEASFGHFSPKALAKQVGLDMGKYVSPWYENNHHLNLKEINIDLQREDSDHKYYQIKPNKPHYRLPEKLLDLIHRVKIIPGGGDYQQGYIYAYKEVQPTDWYFRCHFFQDPVMPGSLGVEAILQAMQVYALHLDLGKHFRSPRFIHLEQHQTVWKYRGQIPQPAEPLQIYLEIHLTKVEVTPEKVIIVGNASLWKPKMRIYEVKDIGICLIESNSLNEQNKSSFETSTLRISQLQINNHPLNY